MAGTRMRTASLLGVLLLAAALAAPLQAQATRSRMHSESEDGLSRVRVDMDGEVRFSDDEHVSWIEPGGRLLIEETRLGSVDRRVEYRPLGGGAVQRRFFRDRVEVRPDARDEEWIRSALLHPLRESGTLAAARVERIFRRSGSEGVLEEIRHIASDGSRRNYYTALLRQPGLGAVNSARVLRDVGTRMGSDGDKRATLMTLLQRPAYSPLELEALLDASARIGSDGDRSSLLHAVAVRAPLAEARSRDAFFRSTDGIGSDGDKSRVLVAVLGREGQPRAAVVAALASARGIGSDGDRSRVLMSVPGGMLRDRPVMDGFQAALRGIGSDGDRARVLTWLARSLP